LSWFRILLLSLTLFLPAPAGSSCIGLGTPVDGDIVQPFAPIGRYAGHWGIDLATPAGSPATAAGSGFVTFSGLVAGNSTVSIDHGGGLKTSYSFLAGRQLARGAWVPSGARVGTTGEHDEVDALHFSVRIDGVYVDPGAFLGCQAAPPGPGLRLVPVPS